MPSLGLLGAVGGLGEGMLARAEGQAKDRRSEAEEAKAMRLAEYGEKLKRGTADIKSERDVTAEVTKAEALLAHQGAERGSKEGIATERAETDIEVAGIRAKASGSRTLPKWMKERWGFSKKTGGEATGFAEVDTVRDNKTGSVYELLGDKYVRSGAVPDFEELAKSSGHARSLAVLTRGFKTGFKTRGGKKVSGAAIVDRFLNDYNYLPASIFSGGGFEASYGESGE